MNRAELFYKRLHQALGLTVQGKAEHAVITEALIMHTLQAGYHCLQEQQRAEAERKTQLEEVVE